MKIKRKLLINKKLYNYIIITLIITFSCFTFLSIKSFNNKQVEEIKTSKADKEMYSVMVNNGDGVYKRYETDGSLKPKGYAFNANKSYCEDLSGEKVTGVLKYDGSAFTVTSDITVYCYLFFDFFDLAKVANGAPVASFMVANQSKIEGLWSSGLEGDGLRYVGSGTYDSETTPSNFICFGTTSASECKANENEYMYRIIGVFPDEEGNPHLKLRKFKQLTSKQWNATNSDVNWGDSTLYAELNGTGFLGNTTYSYLQDDAWSNKIENWKWTSVNTLVNNNAGTNYKTDSTMTPANIYLHEMNRSTKTSTVGEWTYPEGKIGLMYVSDYVLSLGDEALTITGSTSNNVAKLITGWLHYANDGNPSFVYDYVLARYGAGSSWSYIWVVAQSGNIAGDNMNTPTGAAPVFYLTPETTISEGFGTYSEPYIIG